MREIKFRARCESSKKLIGYEHFNTTLNDGYYYTLESEPEDERVCHTNYSEKPMPQPLHPIGQLIREQYTGLTDKNGVEIYERDLITKGGRPLEVKWHDDGCRFVAGKPHQFGGLSKVKCLKCEVVGNIYENPELLEV